MTFMFQSGRPRSCPGKPSVTSCLEAGLLSAWVGRTESQSSEPVLDSNHTSQCSSMRMQGESVGPR